MAEVTSFTAERIQAIEDAGIADANIDEAGNLTLTRNDNSQINAGSVAGGGSPSGAVIMFAGGVIPSGWLLCNGQAVSRTTYAALFTAIGTAFGSGNGSTTFNIPNFEAKLPRMEAAALAGTGGGVAAHTHSLPAAHTHTVGVHDHAVDGGSPVTIARVMRGGGDNSTLYMETINGASWTHSEHVHGSGGDTDSGSASTGLKVAGHTANGGVANTGSAGGGTSGSTDGSLPPYLNINFIIKT